MARLPRFGSALSAVALASMVAGCAGPMFRSSSAKAGKANLAYGLRAQMALSAGDLVSAVDLAEKAVEASPQDAPVRALLGNAYFASGRFASADAAYGDALALSPNEPQLILKRALVQIAQGRNGEAIALLEAARGMIEAPDLGLALALAGRPEEAVRILEEAARFQMVDPRVRQNLALAYALSGDWTSARTVAAQDLSPALVDARIEQWMALAKPSRPSDQVAALVGITPAASDPGQPVRLALNPSDARYAQVEAQPAPVAEPAPSQPQVAAADYGQAPAFAAPVVEPMAVAAAEAPAPVEASPAPAPEAAPEQQSASAAIAAAAAIAPEAPAAFAMASSFAPEPKPAAAPKKAARAAAKPVGDSKSVVQLGAYSSAERVSLAWAQLSKKYPALANYSPMRARFDGPKGTVWRLSIRGFDNQQEAIARCQSLKSRGGSCFVRSTAGDSPVQFASR